ncbi:hypothetical protein BZL41_05715 [Pseudomonas sp. PIC25]|uniref:flagellar hook-length control protein FliK n=1 Tax=Pseudomonas sp. PIC25 TaxID=1958773 RepID=UPI000BAB8072|nr:flagellar hook-length control protein FliK [Pseudomonas sp. PIC25]PAU65668.1 hypothetical protein BZL41_05715 [Pseudomonas sp. PIC25]
MSVAPDLLLKAAPEVKPKAAPAKAPEPRKNEASSFAQVYAKERQAKSAERSEKPEKPERPAAAKPADAGEAEKTDEASAAESTVVADSGNSLPTDPAQEDPTLDPMLLMAMAGQVPPEEGELTVGLDSEGEEGDETGEDLTLMLPALNSAAPASMTPASHDPQLDALNSAKGVNLALDMHGKGQAAKPDSTPTLALDSAGKGEPNLADAMAAFAEQQAQGGEGEGEGDAALLLPEPTLERTESPAEARADSFASKLSALSQAISQQTGQAQRVPLVPGQPVAMQQGGWSEAVVDRVMWLSSQNLKSAEIQLDPAELGRMEVRIEMNRDQTQVTFASPNAGVREALESQVHRLRELFSQQGMNQLDVNVSDQSLARGWQGQGDGGQGRGGSRSHGNALGDLDDERPLAVGEMRSNIASQGRGLVDYYA